MDGENFMENPMNKCFFWGQKTLCLETPICHSLKRLKRLKNPPNISNKLKSGGTSEELMALLERVLATCDTWGRSVPWLGLYIT